MKRLFMFLCALITIAAASLAEIKPVGAKDSDGDIVVIIDPGHGGKDGGATSAYDKESDLNWDIAMALKAELETYNGVKVYLTKGSAEWFSNTGRGRMGAQLGADLFVSVHNNSGQTTEANGVEVYGTVNAAYKSQMQTLSEKVLAHVSALGLNNRGYKTRTSSNDASRDYYTMLDEAVKCGIPGIIIEHCYLGNPHDAEFIHNADNRVKCGIADATAIAEYFGLSKRGVHAGSTITLTRTYSAQMLGDVKGTYTSSDSSVAYVSEAGIITAVGKGSAVITCTGADGRSESVTVNVPEVKNIAIAAGINPTFMDAGNVASYNKDTVMVKAIYSDGSVTQVTDGCTFGALTDSGDGAFDVSVSYNGLSCMLRMYGTGAAGSYGSDNYKVTGTNADILRYPAVYNGINTGISIISGNGQSQTGGNDVTIPETSTATKPADAEPVVATVSDTETEETEGVTDIQEESVKETETETQSRENVPDTEPQSSEKETETADKDKNNKKQLLTFAIVGGVLAVGIIVAVILGIVRKKQNRL